MIKLVIIITLLITSCASMLTNKKNDIKQFVLKDNQIKATTTFCEHSKSSHALMLINEEAIPPFNSNYIFYLDSNGQISPFAINQWISEPSIMIINNLELRLNQSCLYKLIINDKSAIATVPAVKASLQLMKLTADFSQNQPIVVLEVKVAVLKPDNTINKWKIFHLQQALNKSDITEVITVSNQLISELNNQIIEFLPQ